MIVKDMREKETLYHFSEIKTGQCFGYEDVAYIKIMRSEGKGLIMNEAVSLETGTVIALNPYAEVEPLTCEVIVK